MWVWYQKVKQWHFVSSIDEVMQGTDSEGRWNAVLKFCEFVTRENNGVATSTKLLAEKIQSIDEHEAEAALEVCLNL